MSGKEHECGRGAPLAQFWTPGPPPSSHAADTLLDEDGRVPDPALSRGGRVSEWEEPARPFAVVEGSCHRPFPVRSWIGKIIYCGWGLDTDVSIPTSS